MIIGKYDIAPGSGSNASKGSTSVAGGGGAGASVDLTPLTDKIAVLEQKVSSLEAQLSRVQSVLSGLDGRFLSKLGDRSEYSYALGALYTDFIQSELYTRGVGFRVSGSATAAVEDKYNLIVKDVGLTTVTWNTIQDDEMTIVTANTDEATAQLNTSSYVSIGAPATSGYLLLDCGAQLTNERCFTTIAKKVMYSTRRRINNDWIITPYEEAETDSNGNFIIHFSAASAESVGVSIRFSYIYSFRKYGNINSGSYRLYIRGTDPANNQTECFAAAVKSATLNASGVTVMQGLKGARITCDGVQTTNDGGTTWT